MEFTKTTELESNYNHLEKMTISELIININKEDTSYYLGKKIIGAETEIYK